MDSWSSSKAAEFLVGTYFYGHANTNVDLSNVSPDIVKALSLDDLSILEPPNSQVETWIPRRSGLRRRVGRGEIRLSRGLGVSRAPGTSRPVCSPAPLLWLFVFFVIPVGFIAAYSIGAIHILPTDPTAVSFDAWHRFLTGNSSTSGCSGSRSGSR